MGKGNGKALALNTPIATPSGWSTMADLAIGDEVFGPDGRCLSVLAATEPMLNRQCFSVNKKNIFVPPTDRTPSMKSWGRLALALESWNHLHERLGLLALGFRRILLVELSCISCGAPLLSDVQKHPD
jgi:hypothetical protein